MTLDEARDAFEAKPNKRTARAYYKEARQYHIDEIISDETYMHIHDVCREFLPAKDQ